MPASSGRESAARCDNERVQLVLLALFIVVATVLLVRATNRDKKDYRKFKKLKTTAERQKTFGRWLRESFFIFGGLALVVLLASSQFVGLARADALAWPPLAWLTHEVSGDFGVGLGIGAAVAFVVVMIVPVIALRRQLGDIPMLGDIGSLLPRTRGELAYGAGLSLNAGLVEELLFRLGMPALLFGITGNGVLAFAIASVLFGLLHLYQKLPGVLGSTVLGLVFSALYLVTGSIWITAAVHALIDLRSLVLIPIVVRGVWRIRADSPAES